MDRLIAFFTSRGFTPEAAFEAARRLLGTQPLTGPESRTPPAMSDSDAFRHFGGEPDPWAGGAPTRAQLYGYRAFSGTGPAVFHGSLAHHNPDRRNSTQLLPVNPEELARVAREYTARFEGVPGNKTPRKELKDK